MLKQKVHLKSEFKTEYHNNDGSWNYLDVMDNCDFTSYVNVMFTSYVNIIK